MAHYKAHTKYMYVSHTSAFTITYRGESVTFPANASVRISLKDIEPAEIDVSAGTVSFNDLNILQF